MRERPSTLRALQLVAALALLAASAAAQTTYHVDAAAAPAGDGLSWATAFRSPEEGLAATVVGDKVWVKAGTYVPTTPQDPLDPRTATFRVLAGRSLLGGFDGTETSFAQRAGLFEQTILTGDLGVPGDPTDNAYRVVDAYHASGVPPGATRIDGFTITGGYGVGKSGYEHGGGVRMFNSGLKLRNCTIRDNTALHGAGLHAQPAAATLRWCKFIDNHALGNGGGLWGQAINYKISHCEFRGNTAGGKGGAVYLHSIANDIPGLLPIVLVHNSLFHDNSAEKGGAIFLGGGNFASGKMTLSSSTVAFNHATFAGGGIWAGTNGTIAAESTLLNSIVWFNTSPLAPNLRGRHSALGCNTQDGSVSGHLNLSQDPLFEDAAARDLRLAAGSPSLDVGVNAFLPKDFADCDADGDKQERVPLDLDGGRRLQDAPSAPAWGPNVDMGAYER